ncbi:MAG: methyltransferase domain-containing protein [Paracoccus sp. (in: a-proteobacteria)]
MTVQDQRTPTAEPVNSVKATCPICATLYDLRSDINTRERVMCPSCGASGRSSAIVLHTCRTIYGNPAPLARQDPRKTIRIVGLSDAMVYAKPFAEYFDYTNTYYHKDPILDIRNPAEAYRDSADLIINSEVFEHVIGDTLSALKGALAVLKPGGTMIFSVPFVNIGDGSEHYPGLVDYTPRQLENGTWVADLEYADGRRETDTQAIFHGGPGLTLELRLFNRQRVLDELREAGFTNIRIHDEDLPQSGIQWGAPSRLITAQRPRKGPWQWLRNLLSRHTTS